jgi:4-hydroxy-tetrahydrodipicolinate reductase
MVNIIVNGARGRMGQEIVGSLLDRDGITLVGQTGRTDDLASEITAKKAHIVIDVTHPSVVYKNILAILGHGAHAIVGTTGVPDSRKIEIDALARRHNRAVLLAPNFSIGAILMMKFAAEAAKYMPGVEIVEYHHDQKADAPSGTAIHTANYINGAAGLGGNPARGGSGADESPSRGMKIGGINIHAVRLPGFVASQEVILGDDGQILRIRHDTINRASFIPGILLAIKEIGRFTGLIDGLENMLDR